MKRLIVNIIIFIVAILLLATVGTLGLIYTILDSLINFREVQPFTYLGNIMYSINVGIDKIGNVLLASFLNDFAIRENSSEKFGNVNYTISYVLAKNEGLVTLKPLGLFLVNVLEYLDPGHMKKALSRNCG